MELWYDSSSANLNTGDKHMAVEKIIDLVGNSQESWEDAARNAMSGAVQEPARHHQHGDRELDSEGRRQRDRRIPCGGEDCLRRRLTTQACCHHMPQWAESPVCSSASRRRVPCDACGGRSLREKKAQATISGLAGRGCDPFAARQTKSATWSLLPFMKTVVDAQQLLDLTAHAGFFPHFAHDGVGQTLAPPGPPPGNPQPSEPYEWRTSSTRPS